MKIEDGLTTRSTVLGKAQFPATWQRYLLITPVLPHLAHVVLRFLVPRPLKRFRPVQWPGFARLFTRCLFGPLQCSSNLSGHLLQRMVSVFVACSVPNLVQGNRLLADEFSRDVSSQPVRG